MSRAGFKGRVSLGLFFRESTKYVDSGCLTWQNHSDRDMISQST